MFTAVIILSLARLPVPPLPHRGSIIDYTDLRVPLRVETSERSFATGSKDVYWQYACTIAIDPSNCDHGNASAAPPVWASFVHLGTRGLYFSRHIFSS